MDQHPLGIPTWAAASAAVVVAGSLVAWGLATTNPAQPVTVTASATNSATASSATASPTSSAATPSATSSSSAAPKLTTSSAASVILGTSDASKSLTIDSPKTTKISPAQSLKNVIGGSPSTFVADSKECLPVLFAAGSVWQLDADPLPSDTIYSMQDQTESTSDSAITVSQSSRLISQSSVTSTYIDALENSVDDCEEVLLQTSKSDNPVSQTVATVDVSGSKYLVTAYILSMDGYSDATAQAVLRRGNLVTTVAVSSSGASKKKLTRALKAAVAKVDSRLGKL